MPFDELEVVALSWDEDDVSFGSLDDDDDEEEEEEEDDDDDDEGVSAFLKKEKRLWVFFAVSTSFDADPGADEAGGGGGIAMEMEVACIFDICLFIYLFIPFLCGN